MPRIIIMGKTLTTFTLVGSASGVDSSIEIDSISPGTLAAGDLCLIYNWAAGSSTPADDTPSGFTKLVTLSDDPLTSRISMFAKKLDGTETTVTGLTASLAPRWICLVLRPDQPFASFQNGMTPNGQVTSGDPTAQTITTASAARKPAIAWGHMGASASAVAATISPAMTELTNADTTRNLAHYTIFGVNDTLANISYDMDDSGINFMQSGYLIFN